MSHMQQTKMSFQNPTPGKIDQERQPVLHHQPDKSLKAVINLFEVGKVEERGNQEQQKKGQEKAGQ